ncbi:MAG: NADP-dependent malic enzyme [Burkholderiales bacterium]|nr:NADP-dependent malic enzyme [Burkholderiales bacterium]MDE1925821.1 NADP-dependent malic enzyme [Burkholderiales bacterium]MDE2160009.1 NADP-dependent malic enzyme [Burkholderiales bacterium]
MSETLREAALEYHRLPTAGKISVVPTKAMATQRDLALAYSPGVAEACKEIVRDPAEAMNLTSRGNLVGVITNGTAVLGLGNIGALAGKPVMEGKACLFKKFAGIDVFDIELDEPDPDQLIETIVRMEPTFGAINLEDIKAPECFHIERQLRERMKIPVFHDDQHGTAIVVAAAILNALEHVGKHIAEVKLVASGAGAAALACLDLIVSLGLPLRNVFVTDIAGVVHKGRRELMDPNKARYAQDTSARVLQDVMADADIFLGLSAGGVLKAEMLERMARDPIIMALANPTPEITPEEALAARPDAILGTGRSDYPNQVNNVLCFPFIFRGALDVGATCINEAMKLAAVRAIAALAHAEIPETVARAYGAQGLRFGARYLIPKPFDPRLIEVVAPAVAQAAMSSGVAARPIQDLEAYRQRLGNFVYQSSSVMQPVFAIAKRAAKRIVFAEGDDERVLRAVQVVVDEGLGRPLLVGRPDALATAIEQHGLRLKPGADFECADPQDGALVDELAEAYYGLQRRRGVTRAHARAQLSGQRSLLGAMLVRRGRADAMLCGTVGRFHDHLAQVRDTVGLRPDSACLAAMQMLMLPGRQIFICDTHVNLDPTAQQVAEIALMAAAEVRRLGVAPRVALLSHSSFGSSDDPAALKMRDALALVKARDPQLAIEGEMRADAALSHSVLEHEFPGSGLTTEANVLVMPNVDAANISYNLLRIAAGGGIAVGGILLGAARPVHILAPSSTVRRIVNMTAVAAADASS